MIFSRMFRIFSHEMVYQLSNLRYQIDRSGKLGRGRVLVNGSPKTGTTWMLKMMESIPGYRAIGNFQGEIQRFDATLPGDVVHGHLEYSDGLWDVLQQNHFKVIMMLRDPRDQAVSRMFHVKRSDRHRWHDRFAAMSEDEALMACITGRPDLPGVEEMISLSTSWMNAGQKALFVKYEVLLSETEFEFCKVLDYLNIKSGNQMVRAIIERNQFERLTVGNRFWKQARKPGQADPNSHFRKGIAGDWKNYFSEEHKAAFKELAGAQLISLGYERDLQW